MKSVRLLFTASFRCPRTQRPRIMFSSRRTHNVHHDVKRIPTNGITKKERVCSGASRPIDVQSFAVPTGTHPGNDLLHCLHHLLLPTLLCGPRCTWVLGLTLRPSCGRCAQHGHLRACCRTCAQTSRGPAPTHEPGSSWLERLRAPHRRSSKPHPHC